MKISLRKKRVTLVNRMLAGYLLLVLVPTLMVWVLFTARTRESYERMREQDLYSMLRVSAAGIEHNLSMLQENTSFVQNHSKFTSFLKEGPYEVIPQLTGYLEEFRSLLNYICFSSSYIKETTILTDQPEILQMNGVVRFYPDCLNNLSMQDYSGAWNLEVDADGEGMLHYHRVIYKKDSGHIEPLAIYSMKCSLALIEDAFAFSDPDVQPLLRTKDGLWQIDKGQLVPWSGDADLSYHMDVLGIDLCLSGGSQWADELQKDQYRLLMLVMILCVLSTGLYFMTVLGLSRRIRRFAMHISSSAVLSFYEDNSRDELGTLISAYNSILQNNLEMRKRVEFEQMRQREAAWLALQAQINPHFLYNTLETARMSVEIGENHVASDILCALGSQLHYAMTADNGKMKLRDEINHACKYLATQQYRMEDRLFCDIDIQAEALDCGCLKFIVQPLVENAVIHGIAPKAEGGSLQLRAWMDGPWCVLMVKDDGIGVTLEQLEELRQIPQEEGAMTAGSNIGLKNVCGRMRYIYGNNFSMEFSSPEGGGFCVQMRWREDKRRCG